MLKNPKNVKWVLGQSDAEGALKKICEEIKRLIRIFDSKPFTKQCGGHNYHNLATRCTAYEDNFTALKWWCDNCDHYQSGASPGKTGIRRCPHAIWYGVPRLRDRPRGKHPPGGGSPWHPSERAPFRARHHGVKRSIVGLPSETRYFFSSGSEASGFFLK